MRAIFASHRLRKLSASLLGLWLTVIMVAAFQPCAVLAKSLAAAPPGTTAAPACHDHAPAPDCCHDGDTTPARCNLPDLAADGHALHLDKNTLPPPAPAMAMLLPAVAGQTGGRSIHAGAPPPPRTAAPLLSSIRLLI
ncbi:MAG: hypothetical protein ACOY5C_05455 [Pseudomonadota bacterium]|uniref:hypothetical protein n=1 Tax=Thermithiobacillus tepidarius TaxID=929 RepID=UPI0004917550|nr:hypothetical protein [Thermithiobacillus tepidarius]